MGPVTPPENFNVPMPAASVTSIRISPKVPDASTEAA